MSKKGHLNFLIPKYGSVVRSWILTYIVIVTIPIIVATFLLNQSIKMIQRETEQICEAELGTLASVMDGHFTEMYHIAQELSKDKYIIELDHSSELTAREHYLFYNVCKQFGNYVKTNDSISQIGIYLMDKNYVLSYHRSAPMQIDGTRFLGEYLLALLSEGKRLNNFFYLPSDGEETFVYVKSLGNSLISPPDTYLFVRLNPEIWRNMINSFHGESPFTISFKDSPVCNSTPIPSNIADAELVLEKVGSVSSITYSLIFQNDTLINQVSNIKRTVSLFGATTFLVSILLVIYFAFKHYRPLLQLINGLPENIIRGQGNEYSILQKHLEGIEEANAALSSELEQASPILKDIFLGKLIKKHYTPKEYESIVQLPLWQNHGSDSTLDLATLVFAIDRPFFRSNSDSDEDLNMTIFILKNVLSDLIQQPLTWQSVYLSKELVVIIHGDRASLESVCSLITTQMPPLLNTFNLQIHIGISLGSIPVEQVPVLYTQAENAIAYCHIYNTSHAYYQESTSREMASAETAHAIIHIQHRFQNILLAEDFDSAIQMIPELFSHTFPKEHSISLIRMNMHALINLYYSCLLELSKKNSYISAVVDRHINTLLNCSSLRSLQDQMCLSLLELTQKQELTPAAQQSTLIEEIKGYIALHYNETTLSAGEIAEHFGMSLPAISKLFKKNTQIGILDYIHQLRINHAKVLLQSKLYTVSEVAEMTGYLSPSTFIRVFKKYEGISPGTLINTK